MSIYGICMGMLGIALVYAPVLHMAVAIFAQVTSVLNGLGQ